MSGEEQHTARFDAACAAGLSAIRLCSVGLPFWERLPPSAPLARTARALWHELVEYRTFLFTEPSWTGRETMADFVQTLIERLRELIG